MELQTISIATGPVEILHYTFGNGATVYFVLVPAYGEYKEVIRPDPERPLFKFISSSYELIEYMQLVASICNYRIEAKEQACKMLRFDVMDGQLTDNESVYVNELLTTAVLAGGSGLPARLRLIMAKLRALVG